MHFKVIVGDVAADFVVIREVWEELDFGKIHSGLFAGPFFVSAMGIAGTEPKAEGCFFVRAGGEEFCEALAIDFACGMVFEKLSFKLPGPEGLAPGTSVVAGLIEESGKGFC